MTSEARLLTPAFVALSLADLAYFTAAGVLIAVTPVFVAGPLDGSAVAVGLTIGSASISTLLLRPFAGRWTDSSGRRSLLVGGAALFTVVTLGHLVVDSIPALVLVRVLLGAAEAMFFVAGFAALADLAPPGRAGEALSLNSLALYVGMAGGPVLGQALLRWEGYDAAWLGTAVLAAAAALLALRVPETRVAPEPDHAPSPLIHPRAVVPGLALLAGIASMAGFTAFAVLHAQDLGISRWSTVLLAFGGTVIACRLLFARLPDRLGPRRLGAASLVATTAGLLTIGAVQTPTGLFAGAVVVGVGVAFLTPAVFAEVFGSVPAAERGSAAATTSVFIDLGLGVGPILFGALAAASSLSGAFLWVAVLPLAGAALLGLRSAARP